MNWRSLFKGLKVFIDLFRLLVGRGSWGDGLPNGLIKEINTKCSGNNIRVKITALLLRCSYHVSFKRSNERAALSLAGRSRIWASVAKLPRTHEGLFSYNHCVYQKLLLHQNHFTVYKLYIGAQMDTADASAINLAKMLLRKGNKICNIVKTL